ncbi:MAG: polysaccharide biosynthesis protein, partial [Pseudolabrys sp.]
MKDRNSSLDGHAILVTGGTGSFGQAFVRHILAHHRPSRLVVYSRDELKQFEMQQKFSAKSLRFF